MNPTDYEKIRGRTPHYVNKKTGEKITRWTYEKLTKGEDARKIAAKNKALDPVKSYARPAKGRKSLQDADKKWIAELYVQKNKKEKEKKKIDSERQKALKQEAAFEKKLLSAKKRVAVGKVSMKKLGQNRHSFSLSFNDYNDYKKIIKDAATINVIAYSIRVEGIDSRDGHHISFTIFGRTRIDMVYDQDEFESTLLEEWVKREAYFIFRNFSILLNFSIPHLRKLGIVDY